MGMGVPKALHTLARWVYPRQHNMPRNTSVNLTPALALYLLQLIEVDEGENAPAKVRGNLDGLSDELAAIARGA